MHVFMYVHMNMHGLSVWVVDLCSPHGSAATPEYDSRQSTLDYSPSSAEDYDTWYILYTGSPHAPALHNHLLWICHDLLHNLCRLAVPQIVHRSAATRLTSKLTQLGER